MTSFLLLSSKFEIFSKDFLFINECFFSDKSLGLLVFIFSPILFLIFSLKFSFLGSLDKNYYNLFFFLIFLFLIFCFSSSFSFFFLFSLESCVILMVLLIFNLSKDLDKISSVCFMFLINIAGSLPFMSFCFFLPNIFLVNELGFSSFLMLWDLACLGILLVSKVPIFFFHFWLTKAHVSASGSGSMILASLMLKIGTFGLMKFCSLFVLLCSLFSYNLCISLSILSCVILSFVMNRFFDVKYLVACSSILHMSLILPSCLSMDHFGILGSVLMMVGHGLISCFIFYLVTLLYESSVNRSSDSNKGMESVNKSLAIFLFFFFLMNLGFPPMISFISEFFFFCFLLQYKWWVLFLFIVSLILVGKLFISMVLSFLFCSKKKLFTSSLDSFFCLNSMFYMFLILIYPFLMV